MMEKERKTLSEDELNKLSTKEIYKIDIPANRYDLLCKEGITMALKVFENKCEFPTYKILKAEENKNIL